jgi:hypothetical protein
VRCSTRLPILSFRQKTPFYLNYSQPTVDDVTGSEQCRLPLFCWIRTLELWINRWLLCQLCNHSWASGSSTVVRIISWSSQVQGFESGHCCHQGKTRKPPVDDVTGSEQCRLPIFCWIQNLELGINRPLLCQLCNHSWASGSCTVVRIISWSSQVQGFESGHCCHQGKTRKPPVDDVTGSEQCRLPLFCWIRTLELALPAVLPLLG